MQGRGAAGILDSAKECIDHWLPDIVIYTDGSVAGGIHDGGSAAVVVVAAERYRRKMR